MYICLDTGVATFVKHDVTQEEDVRDFQDRLFSSGSNITKLRRFPLNVRAVSAKIKLPKKYLQHCHILRTDKRNLSLLLLPS